MMYDEDISSHKYSLIYFKSQTRIADRRLFILISLGVTNANKLNLIG